MWILKYKPHILKFLREIFAANKNSKMKLPYWTNSKEEKEKKKPEVK